MVSSRSSGPTGLNNDHPNDHRIHNNNNNINNNNSNDNHNDNNNTDSGGLSLTLPEDTSTARATLTEQRVNDNKDATLSFGGATKRRNDRATKNGRDFFSSNQSQSGPSSLSSAIPAHGNSIHNLDYPDEESYEGFGYAQTTAAGVEQNLEIEVEPDGSLGCGGGDSSSSAPSPTGPNSLSLKSNSPCSTIGRHSWLRTSLRRTSPSTTGRQRQLGSNALASQLYRSGSFNSSGRGSTCDAVDDMYSDVSLEDDVIDLNHRVRMIQEQMHALTDTQSVGEERYARAKQENATLQARILMLEEAAKDAEARAEEKLEAEQRRHREWSCRFEREKQLQLENCAIKMQTLELECSSTRDQVARLREQLDSAREDRGRLEGVIQDLQRDVADAREAERQALLRCNEARVLLDLAKEELNSRSDERLKIDELELEIAQLKARNKNLEESRDELQAAAALQAGRELLMLNLPRAGYDTLDATDREGACSLAMELSADAIRDCNSLTRPAKEPLTMPEMRQALKEQQEVNTQLRSYIDGILLNIVENYPQLLEVKQANNGC